MLAPLEQKQTENCMVCGERLTYHEKSIAVTCSFCARSEHGYITCPNSHYVCNRCHNQDGMRVIEEILRTTKSSDPLAIAELAMSLPGLPMLGCQHALLAGGALMAALRNIGNTRVTDDDIKEVMNRTGIQAIGGYCGLTGVCGIVPAIGACISVLTGSKCGTDKEQRTTMEAVCQTARAITALTGPSCCKAYVRASLTTVVEFLRVNFDITLATAGIHCNHSTKHPHGCRKGQCPYYPTNSAPKK